MQLAFYKFYSTQIHKEQTPKNFFQMAYIVVMERQCICILIKKVQE